MQQERQRVILFGDSLVLAGLQARLGGSLDLEVIAVGQPEEVSPASIQALHPAVVIFDLGDGQPDFPLALLPQPELLLIGIDPESGRILVWSCRQEATMRASDLTRVISQSIHAKNNGNET